MAFIPNMCVVLTGNSRGQPTSLVNAAILSSRTFATNVFQIETRDAFGNKVLVPNAVMIGITYIPEPLIGATTVTVNVTDDTSTGWTGGN